MTKKNNIFFDFNILFFFAKTFFFLYYSEMKMPINGKRTNPLYSALKPSFSSCLFLLDQVIFKCFTKKEKIC